MFLPAFKLFHILFSLINFLWLQIKFPEFSLTLKNSLTIFSSVATLILKKKLRGLFFKIFNLIVYHVWGAIGSSWTIRRAIFHFILIYFNLLSRTESIVRNTHSFNLWLNLSHKTFSGNKDRNTVVSHELVPPIQARYIRVIPESYHFYIALRLEFYGCLESEKPPSLIH